MIQYIRIRSHACILFQESKKDEKSRKTWPYYSDVDKILSSDKNAVAK